MCFHSSGFVAQGSFSRMHCFKRVKAQITNTKKVSHSTRSFARFFKAQKEKSIFSTLSQLEKLSHIVPESHKLHNYSP